MKTGSTPFGTTRIRSRGTASSVDELVARELGDGDDGVRRPHPRAEGVLAGRAVPARERIGMAQDAEIVHRDDERRPGPERRPEGRAVEEIEAGGGASEAERVPERVPPNRRELARAAGGEPDERRGPAGPTSSPRRPRT